MSEQYDAYLRTHTDAVEKAAAWMAENLDIVKELPRSEIDFFSFVALVHDESKWSEDEYDAYDEYFYGNADEDAFNRAWLHHIHRNKHHWQHWLLMNDDGKYRDPGKVVPLEMPKVFALEMVADWWSFSWVSGNLSGMFDWYAEHKDNMIIHEKTREYVEAVLDEIRERIGEVDGE